MKNFLELAIKIPLTWIVISVIMVIILLLVAFALLIGVVVIPPIILVLLYINFLCPELIEANIT